MGVLVLMSHLIITLAMIGAYVFFTYAGKSTSAIENMLLIAVGFWFASMGQNAIRPPNNGTQINQANQVRVTPNEAPQVDIQNDKGSGQQ